MQFPKSAKRPQRPLCDLLRVGIHDSRSTATAELAWKWFISNLTGRSLVFGTGLPLTGLYSTYIVLGMRFFFSLGRRGHTFPGFSTWHHAGGGASKQRASQGQASCLPTPGADSAPDIAPTKGCPHEIRRKFKKKLSPPENLSISI